MKDQIAELTREIQSNRHYGSIDEAATKQAIVLRFLSHLGWNPYNLDEVFPEYSVGGGKIDYSLRYQGSNKVFIEVKRVGEELSKHQDQLLNYSFKAGVKMAVLTNGISWWFFLPLKEGSWEQRKFYEMNILHKDVNESTEMFISILSKESIISGKGVENAGQILIGKKKHDAFKKAIPEAIEKIITDPDELFIELIADVTENICGYRPEEELITEQLASYFSSAPTVKRTFDKEPSFTGSNSKKSYRDVKVGKFVRTNLYQLLTEGRFDLSTIKQFEEAEYCKQAFDLNYPLLRRIDPNLTIDEQRFVGKYARYYKEVVDIERARFLVCSQWYDWNYDPLLKWLSTYGIEL